MEPRTENLLLKQYSNEQCRAIFPKKPSKQVKEEIDKILQKISEANAMEQGHERDSEMERIRNKCTELRLKHNSKSLRIDLNISDIINGESKWVDTTCIHSTCKTRIKAEMKHTIKKNEEDPRRQNFREGHAVSTQARAKHLQYAPLINVARKQLVDGIRNNASIFIPAVTSTHGEFGTELISLIEWLTAKFTRKATFEGDREDGVPLTKLSADYRNKTRTAIQVAIAKGVAMMISFAGLPATSTKKAAMFLPPAN
jgi:hypothetical protein